MYRVGSVFYSSGNRDIDAPRVKAANIVRKQNDFETLSQALYSSNPTLQFWAIWFYKMPATIAKEKREGLEARIKELAREGSFNVRLQAVENLRMRSGMGDFLEELVKTETSPPILLRLLSYNGFKNLSERFNPILFRLLNHPDKKVRSEALVFVSGNDSPSRAPMWRIKFDQAVLDKVAELTKKKL